MKKYIPFIFAAIIAAIILSSCSCNYHLKKVAQKCNISHLQDTITVRDTFLVNKVNYDTLFSSKPGDTITITKDRLTIRYVKMRGDSVYIHGKCDTVLVARYIKAPYTKAIIKNNLSKWQEFRMYLGSIVLFFFVLLIIYLIWRLAKK